MTSASSNNKTADATNTGGFVENNSVTKGKRYEQCSIRSSAVQIHPDHSDVPKWTILQVGESIMAAITRYNHVDNNTTSRRFRHQPAPELPTPQFRYLMNGNYEAIIEGATHGFTVKAFTPGKYWRIFHKAPDGVSVELERRFPFDMAAVELWTVLAWLAYRLEEVAA